MADITKFPYCGHRHNCPCSQGVQSYVPYYKQVLDLLQPRGVYEWGPGKNTQMALDMDCVQNVVSVEQEKRWIPDIHYKRQTVLYMQTGSEYYTKGYPGMFESHLFDLFFVDSRRRAECIDAVYEYTRGGPTLPRTHLPVPAVLCLHDAQRSRYHKALGRFEYVFFPHKGFAVATNHKQKFDLLKNGVRGE